MDHDCNLVFMLNSKRLSRLGIEDFVNFLDFKKVVSRARVPIWLNPLLLRWKRLCWVSVLHTPFSSQCSASSDHPRPRLITQFTPSTTNLSKSVLLTLKSFLELPSPEGTLPKIASAS